jgi:hypothetical protein
VIGELLIAFERLQKLLVFIFPTFVQISKFGRLMSGKVIEAQRALFCPASKLIFELKSVRSGGVGP